MTYIWAMRLKLKRSILYRSFLITLVMLISAGASVDARTFTTARELQVTCTSTWGNRAYYEMYAACRAYVIAVADTLLEASPRGFCPTDNVDRGRLAETVMRALGARLVSEEREAPVTPKPGPRALVVVSGSAVKFVRDVLVREFPCN